MGTQLWSLEITNQGPGGFTSTWELPSFFLAFWSLGVVQSINDNLSGPPHHFWFFYVCLDVQCPPLLKDGVGSE